MTFTPGDVVKLVSGGPRMTVAVGPNVECFWFEMLQDGQYGELCRGVFPIHSLRKVETE